MRAPHAVLLVGLSAAPAHAFDCLVPSRLDTLAERLDAAELALSARALEEFQAQMQGAAMLLPCLEEPVGVEVAASYHRLEGVLHFVSGDREAAVFSLRAARRLAPDAALDADLFAPDHPLALTWSTLPTARPRTRPVPPPRTGTLHFDGTDRGVFPARQSTMAQYLTDGGDVVWTARVLPGRELPTYELSLAPEHRLWAATGLAGLATAGLYAGAWSARTSFVNAPPGLPETEHDRLERAANGLTLGSVAGVAVTSVLGGLAWRQRQLRRRLL